MNIAGILMLLVLFIPLTLVSLCHRKIRKYKPLKYDQYTTLLQEFKANISILDVTDEDIKKIKTSINTSAYIIGVVIAFDIFSIIAFINNTRTGDWEFPASIVFLVVLFFFQFSVYCNNLKKR